MIKGLILSIALASMAFAQETTTSTTLPQNGYRVHDALAKWHREHPAQDITADEYKRIVEEALRQ